MDYLVAMKSIFKPATVRFTRPLTWFPQEGLVRVIFKVAGKQPGGNRTRLEGIRTVKMSYDGPEIKFNHSYDLHHIAIVERTGITPDQEIEGAITFELTEGPRVQKTAVNIDALQYHYYLGQRP